MNLVEYLSWKGNVNGFGDDCSAHAGNVNEIGADSWPEAGSSAIPTSILSFLTGQCEWNWYGAGASSPLPTKNDHF